jgi:anti-sigma factor RsiW
MHGSIRDRLEDLLSREQPGAKDREAQTHLAWCARCAAELAAMKKQAALLRTLRAPAEVEPAPGFYARVMQRIEERARESIWSVLIDSHFGKRLAYASLSIAILLGTYLFTSELRDGHWFGERIIAQFNGAAMVTGNPDERRDAVLLNFAAYQPGQQPYQGTYQ